MNEPTTDPSTTWRVPIGLPVLKLAGGVLLVAAGLLLAAGDPVRPGLAVLVAAGLAGWAVRDLVAPVRLAVDPHGVTVIRGFAGRRRLDWAVVERISVDTRPRRGLRTETLEIDAGDALYLFGRYDLGAEPATVADILWAVRERYAPAGWDDGSAE
ncbi:PH domain-containing protein [Micromonospora sp. CPCC 206060]|uniref:PH domain-containing protein n=1 Tax=Micromonospora sp. CPCC 206060 TaxID=3122406 RepID=UPI002FF05001